MGQPCAHPTHCSDLDPPALIGATVWGNHAHLPPLATSTLCQGTCTCTCTLRAVGIEPTLPGWKPGVLPLNDARVLRPVFGRNRTRTCWAETSGSAVKLRTPITCLA